MVNMMIDNLIALTDETEILDLEYTYEISEVNARGGCFMIEETKIQ